jgi:hypothetical protein
MFADCAKLFRNVAGRFDKGFYTGETDFLAQRFQSHVAPAMEIDAILLLNRSNERVPAFLAQLARQIPRPRAGHSRIVVPNW